MKDDAWRRLSGLLGLGVRSRGVVVGVDRVGQANALAAHGEAGKNALERALEDKPIRVLLGTPPKDKHGRALATLYVDDEDVGLRLVRTGHVLVYTAYPFPGMQRYLDAQAQAKSERKGLWADDAAAARAEALLAIWRKEAP